MKKIFAILFALAILVPANLVSAAKNPSCALLKFTDDISEFSATPEKSLLKLPAELKDVTRR